jgi:hypothetical protein
MKKVFQTINEKGNGNCLSACLATLLGMELKDVPHLDSKNWYKSMRKFLNDNGYILEGCLRNSNYTAFKNFNTSNPLQKHLKNELKDTEGINGLFIAGVLSPKFYNKDSGEFPIHAVIVNRNAVVVHDPKEEYLRIMVDNIYPEKQILGSNGVCNVFLIRKV